MDAPTLGLRSTTIDAGRMNTRKIVTTLALMPGMAMAALDRGGNIINEDGDGIGLANLIAATVVCCGVGWLVKTIMDSTGRYTPETTAMATVVVGLFGGSLISAMLFL